MSSDKLIDAVLSVDWNKNVEFFTDHGDSVTLIANSNFRLAVWSKQLEQLDSSNPAICFVREMQIAAQNSSASMSLALYKLAAGSMRAMVETALYYSYFRSHPAELTTLIRDTKFYIEKQQVMDFHKFHTERFSELQAKVDLIGRLNSWYSKASAIIHGQIPGKWIDNTALKDIKFNEAILSEAASFFAQGEEIVHLLLLITVGRENWASFSTPAKKILLKGIPGDVKTLFGLDSA